MPPPIWRASFSRWASPPERVSEGLAEPQISQPHLHQRGEGCRDRGVIAEKLHGLLDRHRQHVVDAVAPVLHLRDLCLEAPAVADGTGDVDVGEKLHLDLFKPLPFAFLAPSPGDVKGKGAGGIPPRPGKGEFCVVAADGVVGLEVGQGIGTGGPPDGALVDQDHLGDQLCPGDLLMPPRPFFMGALGPCQPLIYDILGQGAFT